MAFQSTRSFLNFSLFLTSKPTKHVTIANGMPSKAATVATPSQTHSAQLQPVSEYNRQLVNIHPQRVKMDNNPVIQVPLSCGPTSNATRELDDLMASLSDFKVCSTNSFKSSQTNFFCLFYFR